MYSRVYVEITNICNMNCSFCHGHSRKAKIMGESEYKSVLEQLKGKTEYIYFHLMGEPLTHPELPRFMRIASERGFKPMITTNGTLLDKKGVEIVSAGVHKVNVSLHSFEGESNENFKNYLNKVASFASFAANKGVIVVLRLWNNGFDDGKNDEILEFLRSTLQGEWVPNSKGIRVREKLFIEWGERFTWPDIDAPNRGEEVFCYGLRDHFGILADGTVVPCCLDSDGVIKLGNVFEESLADILSSPRAVAIKKGFDGRKATEELCKRCAYARRFK